MRICNFMLSNVDRLFSIGYGLLCFRLFLSNYGRALRVLRRLCSIGDVGKQKVFSSKIISGHWPYSGVFETRCHITHFKSGIESILDEMSDIVNGNKFVMLRCNPIIYAVYLALKGQKNVTSSVCRR